MQHRNTIKRAQEGLPGLRASRKLFNRGILNGSGRKAPARAGGDLVETLASPRGSWNLIQRYFTGHSMTFLSALSSW
jgi:hypothetical protein